MRSLYKWFVYVSLVFLIVYLARQNLLTIPDVESPIRLALSVLLLMAGFLAAAVSWRQALLGAGFTVTVTESLASMGLSVFGKYIPGKIWLIVGRAGYLSGRRRMPLRRLSAVSLNEQILGAWSGLLLGAVGLLWVGGLGVYGWLTAVAWGGVSILVFTPWGHRIAERLLGVALRRTIQIPRIGLDTAARVIPWSLACWLLWGGGFLLLVGALRDDPTPPAALLAFPLAGTLGILAVIAPGGIGVREGLLVGYLNLAGIGIPEATAVSISSRLWFLIGELTLFAVAVIVSRRTPRVPS